jgi:hypothetical protein
MTPRKPAVTQPIETEPAKPAAPTPEASRVPQIVQDLAARLKKSPLKWQITEAEVIILWADLSKDHFKK